MIKMEERDYILSFDSYEIHGEKYVTLNLNYKLFDLLTNADNLLISNDVSESVCHLIPINKFWKEELNHLEDNEISLNKIKRLEEENFTLKKELSEVVLFE